MFQSGRFLDYRAGPGCLALSILCTGNWDRRFVEKDCLALHVLLLRDHGLLSDLVCDLGSELAFDHELADNVGVELEGRHGFGGGCGAEVEFMGGALFLRAHRKEGVADVDAL